MYQKHLENKLGIIKHQPVPDVIPNSLMPADPVVEQEEDLGILEKTLEAKVGARFPCNHQSLGMCCNIYRTWCNNQIRFFIKIQIVYLLLSKPNICGNCLQTVFLKRSPRILKCFLKVLHFSFFLYPFP